MRLKVMHYDQTRSTAFTLAVWDSELNRIPGMERYMEVAVNAPRVSDKLHALIMIANEVEKADAAREESKRSYQVHAVSDHAAVDTKESVSL